MRIRLFFVALVAMLAACSGSDPDESPAPQAGTSSSTSSTTTSTPASTTTTSTDAPPLLVSTDFGVDDDEIRVGASADLTGPRAQVSAAIIDGQIAFFDALNAAGGIADRRITMVVRDHASDLETHVDNFVEFAEASDAGVVILSATGDEEQTAAILPEMTAESIVGITSSSAAAWTASGAANVLEIGASTCIEAMNGVEFLGVRVTAAAEDDPTGAPAGSEPPRLAIVSRPGAYGEEGAAGARHAASALGMIVVADFDGRIGPADLAELTEMLVEAEPDIVWVTTSPPELAELIVGATAGGLDAQWSGNSPSYNSALLATAAAPVLGDRYVHSALNELWGTSTPAMAELTQSIRAGIPDGTYDEVDAYITGWLHASVVAAVLEEAASVADMTRSGVAAAAARVAFDFGGAAPEQTWTGSTDAIVRSTYFYDVDAEMATLDRTLRQTGATGVELLEGPYTGTVAATANIATACRTVRAE